MKKIDKEEIFEKFKKYAVGRERFKDLKLKNVLDSSKGALYSEEYLRGYEDCKNDLVEILRQVIYEPYWLIRNTFHK